VNGDGDGGLLHGNGSRNSVICEWRWWRWVATWEWYGVRIDSTQESQHQDCVNYSVDSRVIYALSWSVTRFFCACFAIDGMCCWLV